MNKEEFIKELNKNLYYLKKKERLEEIKKYENLESYNLDPVETANQIYINKGLTYRITNNIKFTDSIEIIIDSLKKKEKLKKVLLFFLKILIIIIFLEIPFIYIRDMIVTLFTEVFTNDKNYMILKLIVELIYAITTIYIIIFQFKKKAYELKNAK